MPHDAPQPEALSRLTADRPVLQQLIVRLFQEEAGQDIIEYGLLAAFIGTVGILAWQGIRVSIGDHYSGWGTNVQLRSSCTPDPLSIGGGGCP